MSTTTPAATKWIITQLQRRLMRAVTNNATLEEEAKRHCTHREPSQQTIYGYIASLQSRAGAIDTDKSRAECDD